jgi:tRNA-2-methylthio-N6-dimethylallyladenosine synthase
MTRRFYIETVGCQMNVLDSELVAAALLAAGYEPVDSPRQADTILFNTCSVRQHAEDKIYSALGRLKDVKQLRPDKVIGVIGCMAQKDQEQIFKRAPHVDLVVGPGQLAQLPALLDKIAAGRRPHGCGPQGCGPQGCGPQGCGPQIEVSLDRKAGKRTEIQESFARFDPQRAAAARPSRFQAMVRIMLGCDKFCTYCIVPSVRGPEQSRPADEIQAEVRQLVDQGCLEVTLLGQTVNSYKTVSGGRTVRLSDLLAQLDAVAGLRRLKFVTNYPRHMTGDLLEAVRDLKSVSPYLHVPAQSGSDRVLERMKRGYTVGEYRRMHDEIRRVVPHAAVTSDFIVGFCGETEDDFQATVRLVQDLRFKNSFIFKYSARPGTKAAELLADDVPEEVKRRRNNELLAIQNAISHEDSLPLIGRTLEILVEGPSKTSLKRAEDGPVVQLTGRDACDRIVVFDGPRELVGRIVPVEITEANPFTLFGRVG